MAENGFHSGSNQANAVARPPVGAPRGDDEPVVLTDMRLRKIPVLPYQELYHEMNQAKEHLRRSSQTFANLGRLRAFLAERMGEKKGELPPQAVPLKAMKYILWLEKRLSKLGEQVPSGGIPADME